MNNNQNNSRRTGSYYAGSRPGYSSRTNAGSTRSNGVRSSQGTARSSASGASRYSSSARRASASRRKKQGGSVPPILLLLCALMVVLLIVGVSVRIARSLSKDRNVPVVYLASDATETPAPEQTDAPTPPDGETAAQPQDAQEADPGAVEGTPEPDWSAPEETATTPPASSTAGTAGGLRSATILTCGDVIMHDPLLETALVDKSSKTYNFDNYFAMIGHVMMDADWSVINIEATLREGKYGYRGYPQFSTPPSILNTLSACGIDMVTMCNNHMLDGYWDGLRLSIDLVEQAGLQHVGAYRTPEEYNTPEVIEINGIKVGFLNYTETTNTMEKYSDKAAQEYGFRYLRKADFAARAQALRDAGAEVIVAYMHWGEEYARKPDSSIQKYAKQLVAAGADIIVGGHPHVVQPAEYITATQADGTTKTALCIYSIGNFISDQRVRYTDSGVIFKFTIQERPGGGFDILAPTYIPTYVWREGSERAGFDYRILAIGEYMENPPVGMSDSEYQRMKECWYEISEHLGGDTILTAAIH